MSLFTVLQNAFSRDSSSDEVEATLADLERRAEEHPRNAAKLHRRAARLAAEHNLHDREAKNLYRLGLLLRTSGKTRKAEAALARAADIWETDGNSLAAGDAHLARAGSCLMDRRVDAAQSFADRAQEHYKQAGILGDRPQLTRLTSAIAAMRSGMGG